MVGNLSVKVLFNLIVLSLFKSEVSGHMVEFGTSGKISWIMSYTLSRTP